MAKTKSQLERAYSSHNAAMADARIAELQRDFQQGVKFAGIAIHHLDGMIQYEKRYLGRAHFDTVDSIDFVLQYAPLIFSFQALDKLADVLKSQRRIEKSIDSDIQAGIADARALMLDAHLLWCHLDNQSDIYWRETSILSNLSRNSWRALLDAWTQIGLLRHITVEGATLLGWGTRLSEEVLAKCSSCGMVCDDIKMQFMQDFKCKKCHATVPFVLLSANEM
jgi:hypothetical protein